MATSLATLRPVTVADATALAALVAQLYRAEEPGVLRGAPAGQVRLFTHMLEHELAGGGRGRFLAVDELGRPLGSASVRLAGDPAPGALPAGLFAAAVRHLGPGDALRFYGYLLLSALTAETPLRRGEWAPRGEQRAPRGDQHCAEGDRQRDQRDLHRPPVGDRQSPKPVQLQKRSQRSFGV